MPRPSTLMVLIVFVLAALSVQPAVQASPPTAVNSGGLTLVSGFEDQLYLNGLLAPRDFVFTNDNRLFILERGSATTSDINQASIRVATIDANNVPTLLPTRAYTVSTCGDSERGLLGIALDPNFATNGYAYIYYTRWASSGSVCAHNTYATNPTLGPRNRISRLHFNGNVVDSEAVLVDNIFTDVGYHNAGTLMFGPDPSDPGAGDYYLYASVGEGGLSNLAADTGSLNGKILRIHPDASVSRGYTTTGNPFDTDPNARYCGPLSNPDPGTGPCREIYAYGFRNPFRFSIAPNVPNMAWANLPFVADVGGGVWEEVDLVSPGNNYGWPQREGPCSNGTDCNLSGSTPPGLTNSIYFYKHSVVYENSDSAVISGPFYTGSNYPPQYKNSYFFVDFVRGFMRRLVYNAQTDTWSAPDATDFGQDRNGIVSVRTGPGGDIYYITYDGDQAANSQIRHIAYTNSNLAPIAAINLNPYTPPTNTYTFTAFGSYDPDNSGTLTYQWNCDGGTLNVDPQGTTATCTYPNNDSATHNVTLTVVDSGTPARTSDPASVKVYPNNQPATGDIVLTNLTAGARDKYLGGDNWSYTVANAQDPDGPALPNTAFAWEIPFHHRDHQHPFIPTASGASGQFTIPNSGELDYVVWYRVILYITDARGEVTTIYKDVNPITSTVTMQTNPPGGTILFEGGPHTTPYTKTLVVGMRFQGSVDPFQTIGGVVYGFKDWANFPGPATQTFTATQSPLTLTANLEKADIVPKRNYSTTQPTLTWTPVSWAKSYELQISTSVTFNPLLPVNNPVAASSAPEYTTSGLTAGTYYWRVRAINDAGKPGPWSQIETFIIAPT